MLDVACIGSYLYKDGHSLFNILSKSPKTKDEICEREEEDYDSVRHTEKHSLSLSLSHTHTQTHSAFWNVGS